MAYRTYLPEIELPRRIMKSVASGGRYMPEDYLGIPTHRFVNGGRRYENSDENSDLPYREMDTLDLHNYLVNRTLCCFNYTDRSSFDRAASLVSDFEIIAALRKEQPQKVYSSASEVDEAIEKKKLATSTQQPLEAEPHPRDYRLLELLFGTHEDN